jgi:hypothetical protein
MQMSYAREEHLLTKYSLEKCQDSQRTSIWTSSSRRRLEEKIRSSSSKKDKTVKATAH